MPAPYVPIQCAGKKTNRTITPFKHNVKSCVLVCNLQEVINARQYLFVHEYKGIRYFDTALLGVDVIHSQLSNMERCGSH